VVAERCGPRQKTESFLGNDQGSTADGAGTPDVANRRRKGEAGCGCVRSDEMLMEQC
jgi:hypothetical protein